MGSGIFNKGFWIATACAFAIIVSWDFFFLKDLREIEQENNKQENVTPAYAPNVNVNFATPSSSEAKIIDNSKNRVKIENNDLFGSLSLNSGRIDDISLKNYKETQEENSQNVRILDYKNTAKAYFFETGWISATPSAIPNPNTIWKQQSKNSLTQNTPVILTWNSRSLQFIKTISIDDKYVITVEDSVKNISGKVIDVTPFALILRHSDPDVQDLFISHEGFVGYLNSTLERVDYKDTLSKTYSYNTKSGYLGFTDKYWLTALLLDKGQDATARFLSYKDASRVNNYQVDYKTPTIRLNPNEITSNVSHLFVGPKEYRILKAYDKQYNIGNFDDAIDFGWFFFFTKPMIQFLLWIYHTVGNFGLAILLFTIVIRAVILPIAYKSYISMAKMKELQPKMKQLKEAHASDMQKYNKELMALYKKEKVNPLSGCLPILLQIPIFFSIYKVIFISIELRHTPFWGWISDMSVMDPTNIFTLFGLIPINLPAFLHIGIWPILMGVTMFFQQKLATTQTLDGMQQKIMNMMPFVLVVVLAAFPAGLVIYWTWSNIISIVQQFIINKKVHADLQKKNRKMKSRTYAKRG